VRVLLFTGKGGVGKTSVAAATALASADAGRRTLIISTDPAHSLADSFGVDLGSSPTRIAKRLKGQQLDAQSRMEESWEEIQRWLVDVFNWAGVDAIEAEELAVVPGLDEVFALGDIKTYAESGDWDTLVVDCAPTAETIRLLSLPDILSWYMERVFPAGRRVNRMLGPVLSRMTNLPVAGDEVFSATRRFYDRLDGVKEVLSDRERTSVRLVVNPERMVIAEARRTYTYLSLFGYRVDAVVANRLLPDEVTDPWFAQWRTAQAKHMDTIDRAFSPLPILKARLAEDEIVGVDRLRRFAREVYSGVDPLAVLHDHDPMEIVADGDARVLVLELPFADRDDVDVGRRGDELLVSVGPYRRALLLPDSLRRRDVTAAKLRKGKLRITFGTTGERSAGSKRGETR
jgi:arsenite/tail-anchored protein-transporting ATPase